MSACAILFAVAHWQGFHDYESGLRGYTWCVGSAVGLCDVVSERDPHVHITDKSEWTHTGLADGLLLKDGAYYVSVRAVNNVILGGSMVTMVSHSTPLIVDSSPPTIHHVAVLSFNTRTHWLVFFVNARYFINIGIKIGCAYGDVCVCIVCVCMLACFATCINIGKVSVELHYVCACVS